MYYYQQCERSVVFPGFSPDEVFYGRKSWLAPRLPEPPICLLRELDCCKTSAKIENLWIKTFPSNM